MRVASLLGLKHEAMALVEINEVCCRRTVKILKHHRLVDHIDVGAFIRLARFRSGKIQMVAKFREEKSVVAPRQMIVPNVR